jgi:hypothetical protein
MTYGKKNERITTIYKQGENMKYKESKIGKFTVSLHGDNLMVSSGSRNWSYLKHLSEEQGEKLFRAVVGRLAKGEKLNIQYWIEDIEDMGYINEDAEYEKAMDRWAFDQMERERNSY